MCGMDVIASLKLTAKAPENWWLGDDPFLLGPGPFVTLSPIVMEVENGGLEDDFSLQGGHFPLPWLREEG